MTTINPTSYALIPYSCLPFPVHDFVLALATWGILHQWMFADAGFAVCHDDDKEVDDALEN